MPKSGKTSAISAQVASGAARAPDLTRYPIEALVLAPFPVGAGLLRLGQIPAVRTLFQKAGERSIGRFGSHFRRRNARFVRPVGRWISQQTLDSPEPGNRTRADPQT